jgi:hypothetical protein
MLVGTRTASRSSVCGGESKSPPEPSAVGPDAQRDLRPLGLPPHNPLS